MPSRLLDIVRRMVGASTHPPTPASQRMRRLTRPAWLGTLRRTRPLSDSWGFDRGTPVDRYYIDRFLDTHRADVRGSALEVQDSRYTDRFDSGVERKEVLDIDASNPRATIIADLAAADGVEADRFDCIILTQTLHLIHDTRSAIAHLHRMLRPGGVLLVTMPSLSRVSRTVGVMGDHWRFTVASATQLLGERFGAGRVTVRSYGNVLTGIAFLTGMAHEELSQAELDAMDEFFPVVVAARAVKE